MTHTMTKDTRAKITKLLIDLINNSPPQPWTEVGFEIVEASYVDQNNILLRLRRRNGFSVQMNLKTSIPWG